MTIKIMELIPNLHLNVTLIEYVSDYYHDPVSLDCLDLLTIIYAYESFFTRSISIRYIIDKYLYYSYRVIANNIRKYFT